MSDVDETDLDDSLAWDLVRRIVDTDHLGRHVERGVSVMVRAGESDRKSGITQFIASTDSPDRAGDVVRQDWRIANFRRNPVILNNHDHRQVVGRAVSVVNRKTEDGKHRLEIDVQWNLEHPDPAIRGVGHDHLNGFRFAGSVGFRPGKRTPRNKLPKDHPAYAEPKKVEASWGDVEMVGEYLESNELLEFSSATLPMNPEAAHRSYASRVLGPDGGLPPDDLARLLERLAVLEERIESSDSQLEARTLTTLRGPQARRIFAALQIPAALPEPEVPESFTRLVLERIRNEHG